MESGAVVLLVLPSAVHMCGVRRPGPAAGSLPSGFSCLSGCVFIVGPRSKFLDVTSVWTHSFTEDVFSSNHEFISRLFDLFDVFDSGSRLFIPHVKNFKNILNQILTTFWIISRNVFSLLIEGTRLPLKICQFFVASLAENNIIYLKLTATNLIFSLRFNPNFSFFKNSVQSECFRT